MRILLITPPMVQINAPYPATAYLAGFLQRYGHATIQADASLMLALRLFSPPGIRAVRKAIHSRSRSASVRHFLRHSKAYGTTIAPVIRFLQGKDPTLALRIVTREYLPEGPRFLPLHQNPDQLASCFGPLSTQDQAMHLASLYLDDLTDAIHDGVDPLFELARYGEKLAASAASFDGIAAALKRRKPTLMDSLIEDLTTGLVKAHKPDLIGLTLPFPGNVYGAFRMARQIRKLVPGTPIVMGGGYINTELRELSDPRVFDFTDFITLDDGERPLLRIVEHLQHPELSPVTTLERTFIRHNGKVRYIESSSPHVPAPARQGSGATLHSATPSFSSLPLDTYVSMIEVPNPMHRIWSCGRWNKLMLAHGCYWHRCAFCDTRLDYIHRYHPTPVRVLIERIEDIIAQTGQTGFHFVDEAMPPALLRALAQELIARNLQITWWGNIRFDRAFTPELTALLAQSGCIAVTGGLEAATDRLLKLLDKGFTLEQVTHVTHAFAEAGIMVHAYLMYGCPSQTEQDTIDALEYVRQLFESGGIQSAYWHRFALTVHSPIFQSPGRFGIRLPRFPRAPFAKNEVPFVDSVTCNHDAMGKGLRKALYNYLHGTGLDLELQAWFDTPVPPPTLPTDFVNNSLSTAPPKSGHKER